MSYKNGLGLNSNGSKALVDPIQYWRERQKPGVPLGQCIGIDGPRIEVKAAIAETGKKAMDVTK